jgi:hypothetical protein
MEIYIPNHGLQQNLPMREASGLLHGHSLPYRLKRKSGDSIPASNHLIQAIPIRSIAISSVRLRFRSDEGI